MYLNRRRLVSARSTAWNPISRGIKARCQQCKQVGDFLMQGHFSRIYSFDRWAKGWDQIPLDHLVEKGQDQQSVSTAGKTASDSDSWWLEICLDGSQDTHTSPLPHANRWPWYQKLGISEITAVTLRNNLFAPPSLATFEDNETSFFVRKKASEITRAGVPNKSSSTLSLDNLMTFNICRKMLALIDDRIGSEGSMSLSVFDLLWPCQDHSECHPAGTKTWYHRFEKY